MVEVMNSYNKMRELERMGRIFWSNFERLFKKEGWGYCFSFAGWR